MLKKSKLFIFSAFLICITKANFVYTQTVSQLVNSQTGYVQPIVLYLMRLSGIDVKEKLSFKDAEQELQKGDKKWYQANQNRLQMSSEFNDDTILKILKKILGKKPDGLEMGSSRPLSLDDTTETHILLLGSTVNNFHERASFLKEQCKNFKNQPKIYLLTGKRDLTKEEKEFLKTKYSAQNSLTDESEALLLICQNLKLNVEMINFQKVSPGRRATTKDTVIDYFKAITDKKPQKIVLISSHIFMLYQYLITREIATDKGFKGIIDVAGPGMPENLMPHKISKTGEKVSSSSEKKDMSLQTKVAIALDTIARIFYEIRKYDKKYGRLPEEPGQQMFKPAESDHKKAES